jgi:hypothetical protein
VCSYETTFHFSFPLGLTQSPIPRLTSIFEPHLEIDKAEGMAVEGDSILDSLRYPVSDEAVTSHGTGDNLILPEAHHPSSRDESSAVTSHADSMPSAECGLDDPGEQRDSKTAEQITRDDEVFVANGNSLHTDGNAVRHDSCGAPNDASSVDTAWSESTTVPRRNLGFVQITSLMLNATIGNGIFTTPGYVLALTQSKRISMVLWAIGGVYSGLA